MPTIMPTQSPPPLKPHFSWWKIVTATGVGIVAFLLAAGYGMYTFLMSQPDGTLENDVRVRSFTDCADMGYSVQESYPRTCTANGETFTETISNSNAAASTNSSVSTVGWRTYGDSKYSFILKYPEAWTPKLYTSGYNGEGDYVITFSSPQLAQPAPFLSVKVNSTLDKELDRIKAVNSNPQISKVETLTVGTYAAKRFSYQTDIGIAREDTIIINGNDLYIFNSNVANVDWQQVMTTLNFVDVSVGWKTYTNTELNFSIEYPDGWSVQNINADAVTEIRIKSPVLRSGFGSPLIRIEEKATLYPADPCLISTKDVKVNGVVRTQQVEGCSYAGATVATFFPNGTGYLVVSWTTDWEEYFPKYERALSTFTFTK